MNRISSKENAKFKLWKKVSQDSTWAKRLRLSLVAPGQLIEEFLDLNLDLQAEIITSEMRPRRSAISFLLPKELYRALDILGTDQPLYIIRPPDLSNEPLPSHQPALICPLGDPKNLGAIVRSACAFGINNILITEEACYPYHPLAIKASALSIFRVRFFKGPSLKNLEGHFLALTPEGRPITQIQWPANPHFLIGQEGPGLKFLNPKAAITKISIPIEPAVESLNASVAGSIGFFLWYQSQKSTV